MDDENKYVKYLKINKESSNEYYQKFLIEKSEQQKFLETILKKRKYNPVLIADVASGSGTLSFHLSRLYNDAKFLLIDLNEDAIELAKDNMKDVNCECNVDSIYNINTIKPNSCDLVFCWQTLSWLDKPEKALNELINITKPGGVIYLSSLFNSNYDVDIYSRVIDYTRDSSKENMFVNYNTYSYYSIKKWLRNKVSKIKLFPFLPEIDFDYNGRGLGTYTQKLISEERIQISAGMLLNWAILEIEK